MKIAARQRGFSLVNVMVTVLIFSFGLLGLGAVYGRLVNAQSQSQNLMWLAPWGNSFWGIVQANPAVLLTMSGTYTLSNVSSAPAPLQSWLKQITTAANSPAALPNASVAIQTGPDAASGSNCSVATGCSVTLTISWSQNGSADTAGAAVTRSQTFYYQFGL